MNQGTFPVLFSTPDPEALAERVLPHYPLQPPIRCELLRSGRNDHYLVHSGQGGRRTTYFKIHGDLHQDNIYQAASGKLTLMDCAPCKMHTSADTCTRRRSRSRTASSAAAVKSGLGKPGGERQRPENASGLCASR